MHGEVESPERYRMGSSSLRFDSEWIIDGDDAYVRDSSLGPIEDQQWLAIRAEEATAGGFLDLAAESPDEFLGDGFLDGAMLAALVMLERSSIDPVETMTLLDEIAPEQTDEDGIRTRTGTVPLPEDLEDALDAIGLDDELEVELEVDLDRDGVIVGMRGTIADGSAESEFDVEFTDHGDVGDVQIPDESEIDLTPWIDEERLRGFDAAPLVAPEPVGLVLDAVFVLPPDFTAEGCDEVELEYVDPNTSRSACRYGWSRGGAVRPTTTRRSTRRSEGLPSRLDQDLGEPDVLVGETIVQLRGTLSRAELDAVAATIAPVTADDLIRAAGG